ncbi:MAG: amino acid permease, partial [Planctomycetes bacterium]|nr:amino acid permease [Planctomycetota bacterium]
VWGCAGILTLIGALVCAELSSKFTESGGVYVYLREVYGPPLGFLWGWAMFWIMHSGIIAIIAVVFARYTAYLFPLSETGEVMTAITAIWVLSIINYIGVRHGSTLQALFTLAKLLTLAIIIIIGFAWGSKLPAHFVTPSDPGPVTVSNFFTALVAGLFAFGGWHMVTYNSEETVDPKKTIPRALVMGTLIITACYVAMSTVYFYVLPLDKVAASKQVAADAAEVVIGSGGAKFVSGIVMFSAFGALSGIVLAGPRVYMAMSRDGLLFRWFGAIHPVYRTPHKAILMQALWASTLVATGSFRTLFTRVIYTEWIFFGLMTIGLFILRRRNIRGSYSAWGYPILPAIFVASSFAIVINQIIVDPKESSIGLGFVLLGLPVYYLWTYFSPRSR